MDHRGGGGSALSSTFGGNLGPVGLKTGFFSSNIYGFIYKRRSSYVFVDNISGAGEGAGAGAGAGVPPSAM